MDKKEIGSETWGEQYTKQKIIQIKTVNSYYENNLTPQNGFFDSKFKINDLIICYKIFWIFFLFKGKSGYKTSFPLFTMLPFKQHFHRDISDSWSLESFHSKPQFFETFYLLSFYSNFSRFYRKYKHYRVRLGCR